MRFIVDLYRLIILAGIALALIAISFIVFRVVLADGTSPVMDAGAIAAAVGLIVFAILLIGLLAVIISTHDRIASMSDSLERIADRIDSEAHDFGGGQ